MLCFPAHCYLVCSCSESIGCVLRLLYLQKDLLYTMGVSLEMLQDKDSPLATQWHRQHVLKGEEGLWLGRLQVQTLESRVQVFLLSRLIQELSTTLTLL